MPKEYDAILDGLKNCFTSSGDDALTIEVIREKLNNRFKNEKRNKKPWKPSVDNMKGDAVSVVDAVTSQMTQNVKKIKKEVRKKRKKKLNVKKEVFVGIPLIVVRKAANLNSVINWK